MCGEVARRCGPPLSGLMVSAALSDFGMFDGADLVALANGLARLDLNATRFHRFRQLALEFNLQQTVVERGAFDDHIVC